jgi:RHS repeat-associated protein
MNTNLKNKKVAVLLFCAATGLLFFSCQTSSYIEETISQTTDFYDYGAKGFNPQSHADLYNNYGARNYNPVLGRFSTIDPVAEKHLSVSPYTYVLDKPIYIDLKGDSSLVKTFLTSTKFVVKEKE